LSGRVLDGEGRPAANIRVEIYRLRAGQPATQTTGKDGRFAFDKLLPGTYLLMARPVLAGSYLAGDRPERVAKLPATPDDGRTDWVPVWYPGFPNREEAQPVSVRAGADMQGYEIRLRRAPVFRLKGAVLDEEGHRVPGASIDLLPPDAWQTPEAHTVTKEDGNFEFPSVRRGEWRLEAQATRGGSTLKGFAAPAVTGRDPEAVEIRLTAPFTPGGFVDREDPRDAQGKRKVTAVSLVPHGGSGSRQLAFHEQDGSFRFPGVYPGRYTICPLGFVPGYYLDSVRLGDMDVMGKAVDLAGGSVPIRVSYKPNAGRLRGAVEEGSGATVVAIPRDEAFIDGQFIRTGTCERGRYEIGSLRPGEYSVFAFDRVDHDALEDPVFVRTILRYAVTVSVAAGQPAQADLRVTPWPE
jgi:hypothetical protein